MVEGGQLQGYTGAKSLPETRMNLSCIALESALKQRPLICALPQSAAFREYLGSRNRDTKESIEASLKRWDYSAWEQMEKVLKLTKLFREVHLLVSREKTPMSVIPLLTQALLNEVSATVVDDEEFDLILGPLAGSDVMDMLACRFNLDGAETSGRKVGFMDEYQFGVTWSTHSAGYFVLSSSLLATSVLLQSI